MRILLTANASYVPPRGGATRSNLIWLDHLAATATTAASCAAPPAPGAELRHHESIAVLPWTSRRAASRCCGSRSANFSPTGCWCPRKTWATRLLREAHHSAAGRVVYLAHTPQFFPFGPASWNPDRQAARTGGEAAGIVAIGRHMAEYIERALGRPAAVIHPPIYGPRPLPQLRRFRSRAGHHDQSLRGEGHFDFSASGASGCRPRIRRAARLGHHGRGPARAGAPAQRAVPAQRPQHRRRAGAHRACC